MSGANTSKHLQNLRHAGLVTARRDGLHVYYALSGDDVVDLVGGLRRFAQSRVAEVDRLVESYLMTKDDLEPLPAEELLTRARDGLVTVLDVRPPEEFAQGHLPGAVNLPLSELESHLEELPRDRDVVAYCRGPWCVLSFETVAQLRRAGLQARRLENGLPEWRKAGLPVEQ